MEPTVCSHVAVSSKLLETKGFSSSEEAENQAAKWNALAPVSHSDGESPASVYTWQEWTRVCEEAGISPFAFAE